MTEQEQEQFLMAICEFMASINTTLEMILRLMLENEGEAQA